MDRNNGSQQSRTGHENVNAQDEKERRKVKYGQQYDDFKAAAERRRMKRYNFDFQSHIFKQEMAKKQARIESIDEERARLVREIENLTVKSATFRQQNEVPISKEEDEETRAKYEEYFDLKTDELDV